MCSTIKNCEDVRDRHNTRLYKLADLVQLAVHRRSQHQQWTTSISSAVSLPSSMYRPRDTAPLERYLPREFKLPDSGKRDRDTDKPVVGGLPSTPKKRKGPADASHSPHSDVHSGKGGDATPTGGQRAAEEGEGREGGGHAQPDDAEPIGPRASWPRTTRRSGRTRRTTTTTCCPSRPRPAPAPPPPPPPPRSRRPPRGAARENEDAAVNGRVLGLGKGGRLEARKQKAGTRS